MAPQAMAAVIAASLLLSGLADISIGHYLRACTRPVAVAAQLAGAIVSAVTFLLFLMTGLVPFSQRVPFALAIGLAFRLAYAFYDVPQNAILGLATLTDGIRTALSSLRFVCSGLASLSNAAAAPLLLTVGRQTAWFAAFGAGVGIIGISSSAMFRWVFQRAEKATRPPLPAQFLAATHVDARIKTPSGTVTTARRHVAVLLATGFSIGASGAVFQKLEPYFAAYMLQSAAARGMVMIAIAFGGIASQFFAAWIVALEFRRGVQTVGHDAGSRGATTAFAHPDFRHAHFQPKIGFRPRHNSHRRNAEPERCAYVNRGTPANCVCHGHFTSRWGNRLPYIEWLFEAKSDLKDRQPPHMDHRVRAYFFLRKAGRRFILGR